MKTTVKTKTPRAAKRDLFAELSEGMVALAEARQGKANGRFVPMRSRTSRRRKSRQRN